MGAPEMQVQWLVCLFYKFSDLSALMLQVQWSPVPFTLIKALCSLRVVQSTIVYMHVGNLDLAELKLGEIMLLAD
jgi:hypothetical protein